MPLASELAPSAFELVSTLLRHSELRAESGKEEARDATAAAVRTLAQRRSALLEWACAALTRAAHDKSTTVATDSAMWAATPQLRAVLTGVVSVGPPPLPRVAAPPAFELVPPALALPGLRASSSAAFARRDLATCGYVCAAQPLALSCASPAPPGSGAAAQERAWTMGSLAREELAALRRQEDKARSTNLFDATLHRALLRTVLERCSTALDALLVRSEVESPCAIALRASRALYVAIHVDAALRSVNEETADGRGRALIARATEFVCWALGRFLSARGKKRAASVAPLLLVLLRLESALRYVLGDNAKTTEARSLREINRLLRTHLLDFVGYANDDDDDDGERRATASLDQSLDDSDDDAARGGGRGGGGGGGGAGRNVFPFDSSATSFSLASMQALLPLADAPSTAEGGSVRTEHHVLCAIARVLSFVHPANAYRAEGNSGDELDDPLKKAIEAIIEARDPHCVVELLAAYTSTPHCRAHRAFRFAKQIFDRFQSSAGVVEGVLRLMETAAPRLLAEAAKRSYETATQGMTQESDARGGEGGAQSSAADAEKPGKYWREALNKVSAIPFRFIRVRLLRCYVATMLGPDVPSALGDDLSEKFFKLLVHDTLSKKKKVVCKSWLQDASPVVREAAAIAAKTLFRMYEGHRKIFNDVVKALPPLRADGGADSDGDSMEVEGEEASARDQERTRALTIAELAHSSDSVDRDAVFMLCELWCRPGLQALAARLLSAVGSAVGFREAKVRSLLEQHIEFIVAHWVAARGRLADFPARLFDADSLTTFVRVALSVVLPVVVVQSAVRVRCDADGGAQEAAGDRPLDELAALLGGNVNTKKLLKQHLGFVYGYIAPLWDTGDAADKACADATLRFVAEIIGSEEQVMSAVKHQAGAVVAKLVDVAISLPFAHRATTAMDTVVGVDFETTLDRFATTVCGYANSRELLLTERAGSASIVLELCLRVEECPPQLPKARRALLNVIERLVSILGETVCDTSVLTTALRAVLCVLRGSGDANANVNARASASELWGEPASEQVSEQVSEQRRESGAGVGDYDGGGVYLHACKLLAALCESSFKGKRQGDAAHEHEVVATLLSFVATASRRAASVTAADDDDEPITQAVAVAVQTLFKLRKNRASLTGASELPCFPEDWLSQLPPSIGLRHEKAIRAALEGQRRASARLSPGDAMNDFLRSFHALRPYPLARLRALRKLHAWLDTHRTELGDLVTRSAGSAGDCDDAKSDGVLVTRLAWALAKLCAHSRDAAVSALAAQCLGAVGTLPSSMLGDALGGVDDDDTAEEGGDSEWLPVDVKVRFLCTVTLYANHADNLTRSP